MSVGSQDVLDRLDRDAIEAVYAAEYATSFDRNDALVAATDAACEQVSATEEESQLIADFLAAQDWD